MSAQRSLEWSPRALAVYDRFIDELSTANPIAAEEFNDEVFERLSMVLTFPNLYRESSRVAGVREMVVRPNYFIVYRLTRTKVRILNFEHTRRNWPKPPRPSTVRRRK
ncbi:hypothetical protein CDN99_16140 [Roseateles aquatilis]|uniref:Addiction module toxin RelE n=1 Tax=Roseateles aquatilis TaxID=431061 RepID=A0A246J6W4_9BURK|nr:hypothetical protein CDN99_16140 [Roseateles aquatilis]